jgi:hypothetical protein
MKVHVITAVHHTIPGMRMSVHFTQDAADAHAMGLVALIAEDVEDAPPTPADTSDWRAHLKAVQNAFIDAREPGGEPEDDEDDLAALSGFYVSQTTVDADPPRVVVSLDGGLVQGMCSDVEVRGYVVDYDVEGAPRRDLVDVPQNGGGTSEAEMRGEEVEVDSAWIDAAVAACDAHDADAADDHSDGGEG